MLHRPGELYYQGNFDIASHVLPSQSIFCDIVGHLVGDSVTFLCKNGFSAVSLLVNCHQKKSHPSVSNLIIGNLFT